MPVLLRKNFHSPLTSVEDAIVARLKRGDTNSFVYVVPTKRKVRDLQREFLRLVPGGTAPVFFLFTLETLASHLFELFCHPRRHVSGPAQAVLVNEAIRSVHTQLRHFRLRHGVSPIPRGTLQKILNVINYLKDHGVYPAALYADIEAAEETEQWKLRDVLTIYEAYERMLGTRFIDAAGVLKQLNVDWESEHISTVFSSSFSKVDVAFVAGFDEFSDPEMTLLHNISNLPGIGVVVSFDYHLKNDELFGHLKDNYEKFLGMGFQKLASPGRGSRKFTRHIADHLFQFDASPPLLEASPFVTLFEAADRREEVELLVKVIKQLSLRDPSRDLSKICIAMYQPQQYTHLFRETFERYGIPANITDRYPLDQSPLVVSILAMLAVQQNNFRVTDIQRALSGPYFELLTEQGPVDGTNLFEVAARLKVSAGYKTWLNRINQRLRLLEEEQSVVSDEPEEVQLRREQNSLLQARREIVYLAKLLERFEKNMTPREFKQHLLALLNELGVVKSIARVDPRDSTGELLERDSRAYQTFLKFLDEFLDILELEAGTNVREPLVYYLERLRTTMPQARYNVRQKYGYGVYVTSFEETRGLEFDVMIMAGMVDGEFPPPYQPENFLSPSHRARRERYHLTEHRYLCYQVLTNFKEHLYLSYPRKEGETEQVPSSFLGAILHVITLEDRRKSTIEDIRRAVYSPDELLEHLGRLVGALDDDRLESFLPSLGHDLRQTFDQMRHAIRVERSRSTGETMPEYRGSIFASLSPEAKSRLDQFRERIFSISQLETYGCCPYQYFADKVLRLNVISETEEGLSPLERGGLLHELLFEFYVGRRERGLKPLFEISEGEFQEAVGELLSLASRKIDELYIPDPFWEVDREVLLGTATRKGILQEFLDNERKRELEVAPSFFEARFGPGLTSKSTDPRFAHVQPVTAGNVRLRGKVDRIELGKDNFTIVDYKSGIRVARRREIDLGMSLQLPVYLYAVERILAEKMGRAMNGVAGIYYTLKSPVEEKLGIGSEEHRGKAFTAGKSSAQLLGNDLELRKVVNRAIKFVNDYVDSIAKGDFPVAPKDQNLTCTYCSFRTMCRIQTLLPPEQEKES